MTLRQERERAGTRMSGAIRGSVCLGVFTGAAFLLMGFAAVLPVVAQTSEGEIQDRAAAVARRECIGGTNVGDLCNEDADCPGSSCVDRNVYNISVAVHFNATNAQLTDIEDLISAGSEILFDATDGQAQIGEAFIYNNAFGTNADVRIYPTTNDTWWYADTGSWQTGGSIHASINYVSAETAPGETLAHEFVHLVFDARDEYESRAVGCGAKTSGFSCPHATTIANGETSCLMDNGGTGAADGQFSELCWGQGDPTDLTDVTGGNHDADNNTEQSRCRSNRSCWDQVVWSWPDVFLMPTGVPDAAANGLTVDPVNFIMVDDTTRVVLVLDESGSMASESPSRMSRLQVAANDFVTLAESGTELGIVSYSDDAETSSGRVNVAIASLGAVRTTWTSAVNSLSPSGWTNISAGLNKAAGMITTAGGVTANTFIVLMTDGINNRPEPQSTADAELQDAIDDLLDDGIPVFVTCTGSDLGLESQCAEIASGTNGFYVDSADSANLSEAFVDIHERISHREPIDSTRGDLLKGGTRMVYVEEGSDSVTFALIWDEEKAEAAASIIDPNGFQYTTSPMPQGRYLRVNSPAKGEWRVTIDPRGGLSSNYVLRTYSRNRTHSLTAGLRYANVLPGDPITIYAYPRSLGGAISRPGEKIMGIVERPDGMIDTIELHDQGRATGDDDVGGDGIYTGVYKNTNDKGAYTFLLGADIENWPQDSDRQRRNTTIASPRFVREVRLSAAVGDPNDVEPDPEDGFSDRDKDGIPDPDDNCPDTYNPDQTDGDGDGFGDACDECRDSPPGEPVDDIGCPCDIKLDDDGDGVNNCDDQCPDTSSRMEVDENGCPCGEFDDDGDGITNCRDECPDTPRGERVDDRGCPEIQDCRDLDDDGDGVNNCDDQCPDTSIRLEPDETGCACNQLDDDGDGVNNCRDECPDSPASVGVDETGCPEVPCSDLDDDRDGVDNCKDECPDTPAGQRVDETGCPPSDDCSRFDDDNDGVNNCDDQCPDTPAGVGVDEAGCLRSDDCSQFDDDVDGVNNCNDQCPNTPLGVAVNRTGCPVTTPPRPCGTVSVVTLGAMLIGIAMLRFGVFGRRRRR